MVEISLDDHKNSKSSSPLLVVYSVITCLLVGVHLLALMISTCILPQLEADSILGHEEYESHETMHIYIELAWILSTGFGTYNGRHSNRMIAKLHFRFQVYFYSWWK